MIASEWGREVGRPGGVSASTEDKRQRRRRGPERAHFWCVSEDRRSRRRGHAEWAGQIRTNLEAFIYCLSARERCGVGKAVEAYAKAIRGREKIFRQRGLHPDSNSMIRDLREGIGSARFPGVRRERVPPVL